jgi:multidrug efflux system membrane fusion protein
LLFWPAGEFAEQGICPPVPLNGAIFLWLASMTIFRWLQPRVLSLSTVCCLVLAGCSKAPESVPPIRSVRTVIATDTGGHLEREYAADIRARTESRLGFRVSGKVSHRLVELGQSVRVGQVLAQLDPQDLRLGEEAGRAGLAAAEANVAQAAADLKRFTELKSQGFISQAELDRHLTAAKTAEAALRQARAQSGVQSNQANYATLLADAAGVITSVELEPGQVVAAGSPVLTLAHDGARDAVFAVPEDMAPRLRQLVGQAGGVMVRRWGTASDVPATVREVAASADPVSRTYQVKADVGRAGFDLGQTASVTMQAPLRMPNGIRVPLQALAERNGRSVVWVLDPKSMTVQPVPVVTGDVSGNMVLVASGLTLGQELVTAGVHVLGPGQKVRRYQVTATQSEAPSAPAAPASVSQH